MGKRVLAGLTAAAVGAGLMLDLLAAATAKAAGHWHWPLFSLGALLFVGGLVGAGLELPPWFRTRKLVPLVREGRRLNLERNPRIEKWDENFYKRYRDWWGRSAGEVKDPTNRETFNGYGFEQNYETPAGSQHLPDLELAISRQLTYLQELIDSGGK